MLKELIRDRREPYSNTLNIESKTLLSSEEGRHKSLREPLRYQRNPCFNYIRTAGYDF